MSFYDRLSTGDSRFSSRRPKSPSKPVPGSSRRQLGVPGVPLFLQPKIAISQSNDPYEQEADRVADQVVRMPEPAIQRQCAACAADGPPCPACEEEDSVPVSRKAAGATEGEAPASVHSVIRSPGQPLTASARAFFEPRFGQDLSQVRVHTDEVAQQSAREVNALAYTVGSHVVFDAGRYAPHSTAGQRLLAHELAHVMQQQAGGVDATIQRECSDPAFCTPYTSATEIADAKAYLLDYFVPALEAYFGSDVGALWRRYLSRKPGDSLTPAVFSTDGNSIHDSFSDNNYIHDETDHVLDLVASRLSRGYGNVTQPITNFLSSSEMELSTNFANPYTIPGNIAGGIGLSDAGTDSRRITWGHVSFDITNLPLGKKLVNIEVTLGFEVKDAIDFCPGDCGAILEQTLATIKMSRLEASGEAYDVPFIVRFTGPTNNKTVMD